jgi:hypothetical protein
METIEEMRTSEHLNLLMFSNVETKAPQRSILHSSAPAGAIPFVNLHQYLHDVRHYMTRALSGQVVEVVNPSTYQTVTTATTSTRATSSVSTSVTEEQLKSANAKDDRFVQARLPMQVQTEGSSYSVKHLPSSAVVTPPPSAVAPTAPVASAAPVTSIATNNAASFANVHSKKSTVVAEETSFIATHPQSTSTTVTTSESLLQTKQEKKASAPLPRSQALLQPPPPPPTARHIRRASSRIVGSKVDDHMDAKTMRRTKAHLHDYVHENIAPVVTKNMSSASSNKHDVKPQVINASTTRTKKRSALHEPKRRAINIEAKKRSRERSTRSSSTTSTTSSTTSTTTRVGAKPITTNASFVVRKRSTLAPKPTLLATSEKIKSKSQTQTTKSKRSPRSSKSSPEVAISGSWGRLLSTALGLTDDSESAKKIVKKQHKLLALAAVSGDANVIQGKHSQIKIKADGTNSNNTFSGSMFMEKRTLYPREVIVMMHLLCFEEVKTPKQLPIVQRIIDGLAGFLLKEHNNALGSGGGRTKKSSAKGLSVSIGTTTKAPTTRSIDRKSSKKQITKRKKKKSALEMFSSNVERIESIFLQLPVTMDGVPSHAAENDGKGCPHWCDVGLKMKTTIKLKSKGKHKNNSNSNSSSTTASTKASTKGGKGKTLLATPVLMPIKRSGRCLVPPMDKYVFDLTTTSDDTTSEEVVRLFLAKHIVERIKIKLADYRILYDSDNEDVNDSRNEKEQDIQEGKHEAHIPQGIDQTVSVLSRKATTRKRRTKLNKTWDLL